MNTLDKARCRNAHALGLVRRMPRRLLVGLLVCGISLASDGSSGAVATPGPDAPATVDARAFPTLAEAVVGAAGKTLIVSSTLAITNSLTIPETVAVSVQRDGSFALAAGTTLTINGPFDAGFYRVFSGSGTVVFKSVQVGSIPSAKRVPQWFGAKGDGVTDDTAAFTALMKASASIYIPNGIYVVRDSLPKARYVLGEDQWQTVLSFQPAVDGEILFDCSPDELKTSLYWQATIKNLSIIGSGKVNKTAMRLWHVRGGAIESVHVHFGPGWGDNSPDSVALNIMGCDESFIMNSTFRAGRCILAENQPASGRNNLDHITFMNMDLYGISTHPLVELQIPVSQVFFTGMQVWVGGSSGFYMDGVDFSNLTLENIRWEGGGQKHDRPGIWIVGKQGPPNYPSGYNVTIRNSRIGMFRTNDAIHIRNTQFVLLQDVSGSIGELPDKVEISTYAHDGADQTLKWSCEPAQRIWPALYNVDGSCMQVVAINANSSIGSVEPKIGPDLKLVFSIGGSAGNSGVAYTKFYTSTRVMNNGVCGKPYVGLMDSLYWTYRGNVTNDVPIRLTAEDIRNIRHARIEVTVMDKTNLSVNGSAVYNLFRNGKDADLVQLIEKHESGVVFDAKDPEPKHVGIFTSPSNVFMRSRYGVEAEVYVRVFYYPMEPKL
ncbi:MAG: glycosyl hydrolase family 28-related protein [Kiritimatiellae bacterium]|nr:glycosyl hydrolase family 28-related protein [Kiritimatiellia bacterium]